MQARAAPMTMTLSRSKLIVIETSHRAKTGSANYLTAKQLRPFPTSHNSIESVARARDLSARATSLPAGLFDPAGRGFKSSRSSKLHRQPSPPSTFTVEHSAVTPPPLSTPDRHALMMINGAYKAGKPRWPRFRVPGDLLVEVGKYP